MTRSHALTAALVAGATLRLTRFLTTDKLGAWLVADPARDWAWGPESAARARRREAREGLAPVAVTDDPITWQARLVSGLDCPYCVGTWVGFAALAAEVATRRHPRARAVARFLALGLTLNYVVGHVSAALDD